MLIAEAQQDNRRAFVGGGPGAFVSGVLWLSAETQGGWRGIRLYLLWRHAYLSAYALRFLPAVQACSSLAKQFTRSCCT